MPILFNSVPGIPQLESEAHKNAAAFITGARVKTPLEALDVLHAKPFPTGFTLLGYPNLYEAVSGLRNSGPGLVTLDTDGVVIQNPYQASKMQVLRSGSLLPTIRPALLEPFIDHKGLDRLQKKKVLSEGLFKFLGISISGNWPRQGLLGELFRDYGAEDYIFHLKRQNVPENPSRLQQKDPWHKFIGIVGEIARDFKALSDESNEFNLGLVADVLAPLRLLSFNHGEEGLFLRWLNGFFKDFGYQVASQLILINPSFPKGGMHMDESLQFMYNQE